MFNFVSRIFRGDKPEIKTEDKSNTVLGMALLNEIPKINFKRIVDELRDKYDIAIKGEDIDEQKGIAIIQLKDSRITIFLVDLPIPGDELEFPSKISYLWPEAGDLTSKHKAHIIISVSSTESKKLQMFRIFTKVAACVLTNTNAFGIYLGSQTLVLPTAFYVEGAKAMTDDSLPLMNWIYIGIREEHNKRSGYTYGLKDFGLDEMEILNSNHSKDEIHGMLFNLSHYVILGDITLKDGETIGVSAEQKLKLKKSPGVQLEGLTLKIDY